MPGLVQNSTVPAPFSQQAPFVATLERLLCSVKTAEHPFRLAATEMASRQSPSGSKERRVDIKTKTSTVTGAKSVTRLRAEQSFNLAAGKPQECLSKATHNVPIYT